MRSMTGYGQATMSGDQVQWSVSLRGVNHRFLDLQWRWKDDCQAQEAEIRTLLESELFRGRVEVSIEATPIVSSRVELGLDHELLSALKGQLATLVADGILSSERFELRDLLRLQGALQVRRQKVDFNAADGDALIAASRQALTQCVAARSLEGEKIQRVLEQRVTTLEEIVEQTRRLRQGATETHFQALRQKLEELVGTVVDEGRLGQEAALLVDRGDVSEELDRLASHLEHFREVLSQDGSLGKRLDFLAQEILRELNTIASKCRDSEITRAVVDGKVLCEQLREQVQNVE